MTMPSEGPYEKPVVSVTYDGTQLCHAETALPHLEAFGLKGTFYADPLPLLESLPTWRKAAENGHEIGNGCLIGTVDEGGAMEAWTPEMIGDDIDETDTMLQELFPTQPVFSFGYPWITAGALGIEPLRRLVEERHSVCRSGHQGTNKPGEIDLAYLRCVAMDGYSADEMIDIVRLAVRQRHWIILSFDGVGSGEPSVDASAHRDLCEWLSESSELLVVSTVTAAAERAQEAARSKLRLL
jgi:Polysaccharide deacetylase